MKPTSSHEVHSASHLTVCRVQIHCLPKRVAKLSVESDKLLKQPVQHPQQLQLLAGFFKLEERLGWNAEQALHRVEGFSLRFIQCIPAISNLYVRKNSESNIKSRKKVALENVTCKKRLVSPDISKIIIFGTCS